MTKKEILENIKLIYSNAKNSGNSELINSLIWYDLIHNPNIKLTKNKLIEIQNEVNEIYLKYMS